MKDPMATRITQKQNGEILDDFAQVKESRHSETIFAKKRYTSIGERVLSALQVVRSKHATLEFSG